MLGFPSKQGVFGERSDILDKDMEVFIMNQCNLDKNKKACTCTYEPCSRKGLCCECILYHRRNGELPGCLFSKEAEASYDRSIQNFIRTNPRKV